MTVFTIFTKKELHEGDQLDVYATQIPVGSQVVFKRPTDPLNPIARGSCVGEVEPLETPTHDGQTANVNRFYKRFLVEEEE
jgi:hypothetical protein